jgi:hypothetical protein
MPKGENFGLQGCARPQTRDDAGSDRLQLTNSPNVRWAFEGGAQG